jgi:leader peptidase (prepilin peptidase)/N-methyltransferase
VNISLLIPLACGLAAAWLVNYLADVLPHTLRLSQPACANPDCKQPLAWQDYLLLRGCRHCGRRRGPRTFLVIALMLASAFYLWFTPPAYLGFWAGMAAYTYFILVALIDLEHRLILRIVSIVGLLVSAGAGLLMRGWQSTLFGLLGGFAIMMVFYLIGMIFTRLRAKRLGQDPHEAEEAFGSGDVTLGSLLGLFLGWPLIWYDILLGLLLYGAISFLIILVLALVNRYKQQAWMIFIPLGPGFILVAILMVYLPNLLIALVPK